ncbi:MAG: bifunctional phosphopantothenoylcysteine decarboxylase/phosphopantothenate--cysteine ligase CoaBC [Deferribacteraceae bacterium]|jgi:phosphopantothenoylcysteine decarboxylase/phosphopantothenate--cysteine ligase|nr:bifunctional phosphopantothenoylcysteine decarboxylase/phosphopantothenate--cysteine ligase CoaBC [Deferribacteraceae bacterium]
MSNILLGATGGIACYKAVYLLRLLKRAGHAVRVVMTKDAARFVGPLTFETLSESPVYIESLRGAPIDHIALSTWADLFLIAPASANTIAKIAHGLADNLLTAALLATKADVMLYPAMNEAMFLNSATQTNIETLISRGYFVAKPASGELACLENGAGRLAEPEEILEQVDIRLAIGRFKPLFAGKRFLITAGATIEAIDAVRYISNYSSGKMGLALALAAENLGGDVELIYGARPLKSGLKNTIYAKSAEDMRQAVLERVEKADVFIMNAAVADYTPRHPNREKIKKTADSINLELVKTVDILKEAAKLKRRGQFFIGFAAESENSEENALKKLKDKGVDLIALNDVSNHEIGFNSDYNEITAFFADGERVVFAKQPKRILAYRFLLHAAERINSR